MIKHKGLTVLMDPVFSGNASPVSFFGKAFPGADVYAGHFHKKESIQSWCIFVLQTSIQDQDDRL
jgi:L-ascorbate metabolism protein UlaG (beta-lactamase superfamily)